MEREEKPKYSKAESKLLIVFLSSLTTSRTGSAYCRTCKKQRAYIFNLDQEIPRDSFCIRGEHWIDSKLPG